MTNLIAIAVSIALQVEGAHEWTVCDHGRGVGAGCCHPIMVRECNRILGHRVFTDSDRRDVRGVRAMMGVLFGFELRRHPGCGAVWLASKWRNPWSAAPSWHVRKLQRAARNGKG